jgi:hypothetical protein
VHPNLVKFCNDLGKEARRAWTNVKDARAGEVDSWEEEEGGS